MYNTHLTPFGKFCQDLQEERHETSRQMAKKLKISSAFLCYVKHGQKKPTRRMLYNLIEAYHLHDDKKTKGHSNLSQYPSRKASVHPGLQLRRTEAADCLDTEFS